MKKKARARNFHACHPIMKKGGVHEKTRGAKRAAAKREIRHQVERTLGGSHNLAIALLTPKLTQSIISIRSDLI